MPTNPPPYLDPRQIGLIQLRAGLAVDGIVGPKTRGAYADFLKSWADQVKPPTDFYPAIEEPVNVRNVLHNKARNVQDRG